MNGPPLVAEPGQSSRALPNPGSNAGGSNTNNPPPPPNPANTKRTPKPKTASQQAPALVKMCSVKVTEADGLKTMLLSKGVCLCCSFPL